MGKTIDQRVVEMMFDNKQFETGVSTSLKTIDTLKKGLNFENSVKSIGNISEAFKRVTLGKMANDLSNLNDKFNILGAASFRLIGRLTDATVNWAKQIFNAVTGLEAATSGLAEYETQINAIQTILANTSTKGTTLSDVTTALDELNTYADKTIYNFTEMTKNIGTFTAAGVDLDTSVGAIKGIANLAAVSGSNATQAATAMYQLSQAISSGTVRLMDWNSVQNAGMGGQIFQDALKETARVHGIEIDKIIEKNGSFRESLSEEWLSSSILLETLTKFTGDLNEEQLLSIGYTQEQAAEIMKLGEMANDAATKVKTFTQLKDTLKESAQSGWTTTWELIIGDFEQAKLLFTGMSDTLGALIQSTADARNEIFQRWNDLGGREAVIETVTKAFNDLLKVLEPIKEAFTDIFPPITGNQLYDLTIKIKQFVKSINITETTLDNIKRAFKGFFAALDIYRMLVTSIYKGIFNIIKYLLKAIFGFDNAAASIGDWLVNLRNVIKDTDFFNKQLAKVGEFLLTLVGWLKLAGGAIYLFGLKVRDTAIILKDKLVKAFDKLKPSFSGLTPFFKAFGNSLVNAFKRFKEVDTSGIANGIEKIKDSFSGFGKMTDLSQKALGNLTTMFDKLKPVLTQVWNTVKNIAKSIGDGIVKLVDGIDFQGFADGLGTGLSTSMSTALDGFFKNFGAWINTGLLAAIAAGVWKLYDDAGGFIDGVIEVLEGLTGALEGMEQRLKAEAIMKIASAIAILAVALIALTFVDPDKLGKATLAITALFANLMASFAMVSNTGTGNLTKVTAMVISITGLSFSLLIMAGALMILSTLDYDKLGSGLTALIGITGMMVLAGTLLSVSATNFQKAAMGLTSFSIGILAMSGVVFLLGKMDPEVVKQGVLAIGALAGIFIVFSAVAGKQDQLIGAAIGMTILSGAMYILAGAVAIFANMDTEKMLIGIGAMSAALSLMTYILVSLPSDAPARALGILITAGSLYVAALALERLGSMEWEQMFKATVMMVAALAMITIALNAMKGGIAGAAAILIVSVALMALSVPLKLFGEMEWEQIGKSLAMLAGIFIVFGVAGLVLQTLIPAFLGIATAIFILGAAGLLFGKAVAAFAAGFAIIVGLGAAGITVVTGMLTAIAYMMPLIAQQLGIALTTFVVTLNENAPVIWAAVTAMLLGLISTFEAIIPAIVAAGVLLISELVKGLLTTVPMIVAAALDLIIALLTELAAHMEEITTIAIDVVLAFIDGVAQKIPDIIQSAWDLIISFIDGVTDGVEKNLPTLIDSIANLGSAIIDGLIEALTGDGLARLLASAVALGEEMIKALKGILGIKSPSKRTHEIGEQSSEGFVNGILSLIPKVVKASKDLGNKAIGGLSGAIGRITDSLNTNIDMNPTITPVVDLSEVIASGRIIDGILPNGQTITVSGSLNRAGDIASMQSNQNGQNGSEMSSQINPQTIQFVQNNYSPEALSRMEIYRMTRNQLAMMKGVVTP